MSPDELYDLTFREFANKLEGHNERTEHEYKQRLDAARFTASLVISALAGKSFAPTDIVRFPWEKPAAVPLMPVEKFRKLKKHLTT